MISIIAHYLQIKHGKIYFLAQLVDHILYTLGNHQCTLFVCRYCYSQPMSPPISGQQCVLEAFCVASNDALAIVNQSRHFYSKYTFQYADVHLQFAVPYPLTFYFVLFDAYSNNCIILQLASGKNATVLGSIYFIYELC